MSELSESGVVQKDDKCSEKLRSDDVVQQSDARAAAVVERNPKLAEGEVPPKKRKTRRGKCKRRQPYMKYGRNKFEKNIKNKIVKPEAPHNSNQFLLEDHGIIEELEDENIKYADQASTSTITRTRDSSFSVDSDGEFYSSPDDEEQFLMKDFNDQYQSFQTEELQRMSKAELIEEYLLLESRYQQEQSGQDKNSENTETVIKLQKEVDRLRVENERLQRENEQLKSKISTVNSDSEDSETDSSDSCSSSSGSCSSSSCCSSSKSPSPVDNNVGIDYTKTNGHSSPIHVEPI